MRNLSLDEKISIKGKLARKGVMPHVLVQLDMAAALRLHWASFGTPAALHSNSTPKLWRKSWTGSRHSAGARQPRVGH